MKITSLETLRLKRRPNLIWVRVHTDQGLVGLGETWFGASAVEADLHDRIAPLVLGEDARRIDALNHKMRPYAGFCGTGAELRAVSAMDVAFWDLAGKAAGAPISALLGGATRKRIRVYNTCAGPAYVSQTADVRPKNFGVGAGGAKRGKTFEDLKAFLERPAELAAELLEMGIASMKIWPFDFAAGAADGMDLTNEDLAKALAPFERIRKAHGSKMKLKAELHGLWSLPAAKKIAAALEPLDMDWIEDPVWMDRMDELGELARSTRAPLAGGETLGGLGQIRALIAQGNVSVPIVDVTWGGGISFAHKAAALAQAFGRPIAFHDCSGPVTLTASIHLALACANVWEQEMVRAFYYGWYHELVDRLPPLERGEIGVPEGPGLGLDLLPELERSDDAIRRESKA